MGLFVVFHLLDLTWGTANPKFVSGDVYHNVVSSLGRVPIASICIAANAALAVHIFHGAWSVWQSLGWSNPRFRWLRVWMARGLAAVIFVGNVSFPVAVQLGIASEEPAHAPTAAVVLPAPQEGRGS